jgi:hypothetical protein
MSRSRWETSCAETGSSDLAHRLLPRRLHALLHAGLVGTAGVDAGGDLVGGADHALVPFAELHDDRPHPGLTTLPIEPARQRRLAPHEHVGRHGLVVGRRPLVRHQRRPVDVVGDRPHPQRLGGVVALGGEHDVFGELVGAPHIRRRHPAEQHRHGVMRPDVLGVRPHLGRRPVVAQEHEPSFGRGDHHGVAGDGERPEDFLGGPVGHLHHRPGDGFRAGHVADAVDEPGLLFRRGGVRQRQPIANGERHVVGVERHVRVRHRPHELRADGEIVLVELVPGREVARAEPADRRL